MLPWPFHPPSNSSPSRIIHPFNKIGTITNGTTTNKKKLIIYPNKKEQYELYFSNSFYHFGGLNLFPVFGFTVCQEPIVSEQPGKNTQGCMEAVLQ
jgi:hypothetical protein